MYLPSLRLAARMCGKARPFLSALPQFCGFAANLQRAAQPRGQKADPERHSLSAHPGGKAAPRHPRRGNCFFASRQVFQRPRFLKVANGTTKVVCGKAKEPNSAGPVTSGKRFRVFSRHFAVKNSLEILSRERQQTRDKLHFSILFFKYCLVI